jgi:hypothetical protein
MTQLMQQNVRHRLDGEKVAGPPRIPETDEDFFTFVEVKTQGAGLLGM